MPFSAARDLGLVMKARSEAAGAMRSFSRDIRMVGDSVVEAQLRASRATLQNEMATKRLATAYQTSLLRQGQQTTATHAAIRALQDETKAFLLGKQLQINAIDKEIHGLKAQRAATEELRDSSQ